MENIRKAYTHAGVFHADDVFGAALLTILFPEIEIVRTFKIFEPVRDDEIVFDIGGGKFDHHKELEYRDEEKTMPYAAFGLLWREYGHELVSDIGFKLIERDLVIPIDKADNGLEFNPLTSLISKLNVSWNNEKKDDPEYLNGRFKLAVRNAEAIFMTFIDSTKHIDAAAKVIEESKDKYKDHFDNHVLVLDKYVPWKDICKEMEYDVRFAVYPSLRGGYNIESIDSEQYPLPKEWLSKLPEGITFCHLNRFLAAVTTFEDAIKYAYVASDEINKFKEYLADFTAVFGDGTTYSFNYNEKSGNITIGTIWREAQNSIIIPKDLLDRALSIVLDHPLFMINTSHIHNQ